MKFSCSLLFFFTLFMPVAIQSQEIWEQTNGAYGGYVQTLVLNSVGDIFAGTEGGGVFRSTDNGDNWSQINSGLPVGPLGQFINTLAINSMGDIFAATSGGGIFRSTDNGDNWRLIKSGLNATQVHFLAINSNDDIFAGTLGGGVLRSTDNGDNWSRDQDNRQAALVSNFQNQFKSHLTLDLKNQQEKFLKTTKSDNLELGASAGCQYVSSCSLWQEKGKPAICNDESPQLQPMGKEHFVACHFCGD